MKNNRSVSCVEGNEIPKSKRTDKAYLELLNYFEPIMGYSLRNRTGYAVLLSSGFSLSYWKPFCELISTSDELFPRIVSSLTGRLPSTQAKTFLLELANKLLPDKFFAYLYRQVKANASEDFHSLKKIYFRLGIGDGKVFGSKRYFSEYTQMINDAMTCYWEEDDSIFKARPNQYATVSIKYKNIETDIGVSASSEGARRIVLDYNNLKALILDIYNGEKTIPAIRRCHHIFAVKFDKLFTVYNPEKVLKEFEEQLEIMIQDNIPILGIHQGYYRLFGNQGTHSARALNGSKLKEKYEAILYHKRVEQRNRRFASNLNILRERRTSFSLVFLRQNRIRSLKYEAKFRTMPIFTEWAEYMLSLGDRLIGKGMQDSTGLINYIVEKHPERIKLCSRDITKRDLTDFLKNGGISQRGAIEAKAFLGRMIDFLISKKSDGKIPLIGPLPEPPTSNVCKDIFVKKVDHKNRIPIDENVFVQITAFIDELEMTYRNAFKLIAAGGLRPNELEGITIDSLVEKNGKRILHVWEFKKEKLLAKRGKKPIREFPLNDPETIKAFEDQVRESENARRVSGHDSIFIRKREHFNIYSIVTAEQLGTAVNKLIKKHNIRSPLTGELWNYTPYQLRVSLVVDMIENGASDKQLKSFFGWIADKTMENAYYMARKLKLMEMDTEFFKKEFSIQLSKTAIDQYSENELHEIVTMFYATSREMAYGRCMRHPSQGICGKLHEASACAPCTNLKAAPQYRSKWEELYVLQYKELKRLRIFYEQRGHVSEQYEKYEFYVVQSGILTSYANVLMNIDRPKEINVVKWHE